LTLFAGADIVSVTIVVGAFLAGLGVGSALGGSLADRLTSRQALIAFVFCNFGIAAFALASKALFYDLLFLTLPSLAVSRSATLGVSFLALLVPTTLMGLSLPILSRAVVRSIDGAARSITRLYFINTLGAACGALLGGWFLVGRFGFVGMLRGGALLNTVAALTIAAALWREAGSSQAERGSGADDQITGRMRLRWISRRDGMWFGLVVLAGFMAISLQLVWFRLFAVLLVSRTYVFPVVLTGFLLFDAIGAALGAWLLTRIRDPRPVFFAVQGLVALGAVSTTWLLCVSFGSLEPVLGREPGVLAIVALVSVLIGPQAMLIGFYFPLAHKAVQRDRDKVAMRTGLIDFGIVLGNTLGSVLTGLVLFEAIGTTGTLRLLVLVGCVFVAAVAFDRMASGRRRAAAWMLLGALGISAFGLPDQQTFWTVLSRAVPPDRGFAFAVEDETSVAVVLREPRNARHRSDLITNGRRWGHVEPFFRLHGFLGLIGPLVHPDPREVLIIGLGSAATAYAAGVDPRTERIDVVEIAMAQRTALARLVDHAGLPAVREVLTGSRFHIIPDDGRRFLMTQERRYDIIEADPMRPTASGSGMLFSTEFFELARSRLKPRGLLVQWTPTPRVQNGVRQVFPYGVEIGKLVMLGSNEPIDFDVTILDARLREVATGKYLELGGYRVHQLRKVLAANVVRTWDPDTVWRPDAFGVNTDLFPKDEYSLRRLTKWKRRPL
jgi:spermidine synthase